MAPQESFLRSSTGGLLLGASVLAALAIPASAPMFAVAVAVAGEPAWFRPAWIAADVAGLLAGMRVWRLRPSVHGGRLLALDESPAARAAVRLQLADSIDAALDVLAQERVQARDLERLAAALRHAGARFWHELPERQGDVYALVARHVPPEVASVVAGLLLEGAGRKERSSDALHSKRVR